MRRLALILVLAGAIALTAGTALAQRASGQTVSGTAEEVTAGSLVVRGKTVVIDENTKVEGTLTTGATVVIKTEQVGGVLHAARIMIKEGNSDAKRKYAQIEGEITGVSANHTFVLRSRSVTTNDGTRIEGELAVGAYASVKAETLADGTLLALKIEIEEEGDDDDEAAGYARHHRGDDDEDAESNDDDDSQPAGTGSPAPTQAPGTPVLNGQQLFNANCTGCHGVPSTNRTQSRLAAFISSHNTGRNLTQEQAAAIAAWLKP